MSGSNAAGCIVYAMLCLLPLLSFLAGSVSQAHPLAPVLLQLEERGDGLIEVSWKQPLRVVDGAERRPVLPAACVRVATLAGAADGLSTTERWLLDCGVEGLVGRQLGVSGLEITGTDALLRLSLRDGRGVQRVLRPSAPIIEVPERTPRLAVARDYAGLGVRHILGGADHLLFVFGLLLLVGGGRRLVQTVTAFTVGHSITLGLATLGFVHFPSRPIEVLIALSVFWLAVDLARDPNARASWMRRAPWLMAGTFGLLHGLGFAGALAEVGLPEGEIPLALLSFNCGIEAGQLLFVSVMVAARQALRWSAVPLPAWGARVPVYAMGSLAAFWCFERAALLLP
jgi:hydrogenase/urease accessory protein HupE